MGGGGSKSTQVIELTRQDDPETGRNSREVSHVSTASAAEESADDDYHENIAPAEVINVNNNNYVESQTESQRDDASDISEPELAINTHTASDNRDDDVSDQRDDDDDNEEVALNCPQCGDDIRCPRILLSSHSLCTSCMQKVKHRSGNKNKTSQSAMNAAIDEQRAWNTAAYTLPSQAECDDTIDFSDDDNAKTTSARKRDGAVIRVKPQPVPMTKRQILDKVNKVIDFDIVDTQEEVSVALEVCEGHGRNFTLFCLRQLYQIVHPHLTHMTHVLITVHCLSDSLLGKTSDVTCCQAKAVSCPTDIFQDVNGGEMALAR